MKARKGWVQCITYQECCVNRWQKRNKHVGKSKNLFRTTSDMNVWRARIGRIWHIKEEQNHLKTQAQQIQ